MFSAKRYAPLALLLLAVTSVAPAQTVRFQTSVGAFDMLLNPTNNANLQPLVDNMLANVAAGLYRRSVVNRAVEDFVLQIGSFTTESRQLSEVPQFGFDSTNSFDPVVVDSNGDGQVDFDTSALTNTRGTISLALSSAGPNSGSSSFFINLTDNSFLDDQGFVPFARIADMTVIDRIMGLDVIDLSADVGQQGSLAYTDVPLALDGNLVVIETATVISENNTLFLGPLRNAFGIEGVSGSSSSGSSSSSASMNAIMSSATSASNGSSLAIPEPTALFLAMIGLAAAKRR
jgi:cyclophilin family peptidyl-prolyl cis-trans isomerase